MIAQITGKIISKKTTEVVIDCSGVGYLLIVPASTSEKINEVGQIVALKTVLIPREDALLLFGFNTEVERDVFKLLLTVTGIGPKSAIAILSSVSIDDFRQAIAEDNLLLLQKMPGIGKKTAERLIIELRDKIIKTGDTSTKESSNANSIINNTSQEAISALVILGYNKTTSERAVKKAITALIAEQKNINVEEIIRTALKFAIE